MRVRVSRWRVDGDSPSIDWIANWDQKRVVQTRTRRGFCRGRVREGNGEGWRVHRDERSGRDELSHRLSGRVVGFSAHGSDYWTSAGAMINADNVPRDAHCGDYETDYET